MGGIVVIGDLDYVKIIMRDAIASCALDVHSYTKLLSTFPPNRWWKALSQTRFSVQPTYRFTGG